MGNRQPAPAVIGAIAVLTALSGPAANAEGQPQSGNYTELLTLNLQAGGHAWHLDKTYNPPGNQMMEYVPEGQTGQNWSEMITTITIHTQPQPNVANIIAGIVGRFRATCGKLDIADQNVVTETDDMRKNAGLPATYRTFSVLLKCEDPKPPPSSAITLKKHEVLLLKGIQGWLFTYLVQRAWHSDTVEPSSILASDKTHKEWQDWSDTIRIAGVPDSLRSKK